METISVFFFILLNLLGLPFQVLGFLAGFVWVSLSCGYLRFTDFINKMHYLLHKG